MMRFCNYGIMKISIMKIPPPNSTIPYSHHPTFPLQVRKPVGREVFVARAPGPRPTVLLASVGYGVNGKV